MDGVTVLAGTFDFEASWEGVVVKDSYDLRIEVGSYPEALPVVFETGGRIPRRMDEHVFESSGRLCLGSELRLRQILGPNLNLMTFAEQCVVPFLYAATRRVSEGRYVFGELPHGRAGLFEDYQVILGVQGEPAVRAALRILAIKRSTADGHPCPCGCGKRLAQCAYRDRIEALRQLGPRKIFLDIFEGLSGFTAGRKQ
jgi:hypothetical protein